MSEESAEHEPAQRIRKASDTGSLVWREIGKLQAGQEHLGHTSLAQYVELQTRMGAIEDRMGHMEDELKAFVTEVRGTLGDVASYVRGERTVRERDLELHRKELARQRARDARLRKILMSSLPLQGGVVLIVVESSAQRLNGLSQQTYWTGLAVIALVVASLYFFSLHRSSREASEEADTEREQDILGEKH
jgi:hypothetical protein